MSERSFQIETLSIFPGYFEVPLGLGVVGRAIASGRIEARHTDVRAFATDKHRTTDDLPFGGGAGMVMKPEPLVLALESARARAPDASRIYLTPQGRPLTQSIAYALAHGPGLILVCGRYEGIDFRVRQGWIDDEISIGDYVLSGGEPAALVLIDAVCRLIPGVLGNPDSLARETFTGPRFDHPHYTRPRIFRGLEVPEELLSGHHARIKAWRSARAERLARRRRPELAARREEE